MKIMLCCRVYATHGRPGGMIHVVTDRAEMLASMGHDVHVVTTKLAAPSVLITSGVNVHHCPDGVPMEYGREYTDFCVQMHKSLNPDILHLDSYDKNRLWWHGLKASVTNHGETIGSQLTQWRMKRTPLNSYEWVEEERTLKGANTVIATCKFDRWMLSDLLSLKQVKLVYNPIAPYFFTDASCGRRTDELLFTALWGQTERGYLTMQKAAAALGVVYAVPKCSRRALVPMYDRAKALVLPGWHSCGFDLCVAEALSRGCPVIMGDCGIATMENNPGISVVRPGDADAVVEALKQTYFFDSRASQHHPKHHCEKWLEAVQ